MATIGEKNYKEKELNKMLENGATIFRFNAARIKENKDFDFKTNPKVSEVLENIKLLSEARRQPITTSLDLEGPKVRVRKLISIHEREKEPREGIPLNHPEVGDIVYLYSNNVKWKASHIKKTLNGIDSQRIKNASTGVNKNKESEYAPDSIDKIWRIHISIHDFDTVNDYISIKDGKCNLRIKTKGPKKDFVITKVEEVAEDFFFSSKRQGVNPKGYLFPNILQKKDLEDFEWGLKNNIDLICVSFVCSPLEYFELKKKMDDFKKNEGKNNWHRPLIFAKIETIFAVNEDEAVKYFQAKDLNDRKVCEKRIAKEDRNRYLRLIDLYVKNPIKAICETFDGVMVARGDLAVEADKYHVPFYQKGIINACRLCNKPVIIATEVLESMKKKGSPSTRAEIGDIATAVVDEADAIMLAGEVASTESDPASVVSELKDAIKTAEDSVENETWLKKAGDIQYFYEKFSSCSHETEAHLEEMKNKGLLSSKDVEAVRLKIGMGSKVCIAARAKNASAIFVSVTTGETSKYVSHFRPPQQIISIGSSLEVARRLVLWKGIYPVVMQYPPKYELNDFILIAREVHSEVHIMPTAKKSEKEEEEKKEKKEGNEKEEFIIPALLRIESKLQDGKEKKLLPNTVHDISLEKTPKDKKPEGIAEREKKYILTKKDYKKLREYLEEEYDRNYTKKIKYKLNEDLKKEIERIKQDKKKKQKLEKEFKKKLGEFKPKTKLIEQKNYYFHDKSSVIVDNEAMIRIRVEEVNEKLDRIVLTIKKKAQKLKDGTAVRWEKEFHVTPYFESEDPTFKYKDPIDSFEYLPDFFRNLIYEEFREDFKGEEITAPEKIELENVASMANTRLTVETHSELVLELDSFSTKDGCNYYELEIETIPADEGKRDEYVELLFKSLGIKDISHEDYPPKSVMTLLDFGLIPMTDKFRNAIKYVRDKLNISPRNDCAGAACT
jgi:pyruvate kinase